MAYQVVDLANDAGYRDDLRRFAVLGRVSAMVHDRVEIGGFLVGADAERSLTGFAGNLAWGGGGDLRLYGLLQEDYGINLALAGGYGYLRNRGTIPDPNADGARIETSITTHEYYGGIVVSRTARIWNLYGGVLWYGAQVRQPTAYNVHTGPGNDDGIYQRAAAAVPLGIFAGIDYFVTPLVYFSFEAQNFHDDLIAAAIGILLAP